MLFSELRKKQVVNVLNGACIGQISDLVLDDTGKYVKGFVVPGTPTTFMERVRGAANIIIPISCVQTIGNDVILARIDGYRTINEKEK